MKTANSTDQHLNSNIEKNEPHSSGVLQENKIQEINAPDKNLTFSYHDQRDKKVSAVDDEVRTLITTSQDKYFAREIKFRSFLDMFQNAIQSLKSTNNDIISKPSNNRNYIKQVLLNAVFRDNG